MQKTKKNSSEFSGLIFRISDHQKTANSSESSIAPGPVIQVWTIKGCMESGSAISWRLGPRTLPKKNTRPKSNGLRELHKQSSQIDNQILADLWFEIRAQR